MTRHRGSITGTFLVVVVGSFFALVPPVPCAEASVPGGTTSEGLPLIEIRAERLVVPPVAIDLFDSRPDASLPDDGVLGIGVVVEFTLDGRARVLDAVAGPITWYRLVRGEWSAIEKAQLSPELEGLLKQAAVEGAIASIFVIPERHDVEPSGMYRGLAEMHWLIPEQGTLPGGVGGIVRGKPWDPGLLSAADRPTADARPPELVQRVSPIYPEDARQAGIEGKVILQVTIDTEGYITDVDVLRRPNEAYTSLEEAAMDAVKQWRYRPATCMASRFPSS